MTELERKWGSFVRVADVPGGVFVLLLHGLR